jgi:hypothetical protein
LGDAAGHALTLDTVSLRLFVTVLHLSC